MRPEIRRESLQTKVMVMYICLNCGKEVDIDLRTAKKIICPFCGYRILKKPRPKIMKKVLAK